MTKFSKKESKTSRFKKANDCGFETWGKSSFCFTDMLYKRKSITIILL